MEGEETEHMSICKGVCQGCILSPVLFNVYSEAIFEEVLQEKDLGVKINGEIISEIRYADDRVLIADSDAELQEMLNAVNGTSEKYGLEMNVAKTKFMVVHKEKSSHNIAAARIIVKGQEWIHDQIGQNIEIKTPIETERSAFIRMKSIFN